MVPGKVEVVKRSVSEFLNMEILQSRFDDLLAPLFGSCITIMVMLNLVFAFSHYNTIDSEIIRKHEKHIEYYECVKHIKDNMICNFIIFDKNYKSYIGILK